MEIKEFFYEKDIKIIIGENASGKTFKLKEYYNNKSSISENEITLFYGVDRNIKDLEMNEAALNNYFENILDFNIKRKNVNPNYFKANISYCFKYFMEEIVTIFEQFFGIEANEIINIDELSDGHYSMLVILSELLQITNHFPNAKIELIIDEAEAYLYPQQQEKMVMFLKEFYDIDSVIVSTHSPHIIKGVDGEVNLLKIINNNDVQSEIININNMSWEAINEDLFGVEYYPKEFQVFLEEMSKILYDKNYLEKLDKVNRLKLVKDIEQVKQKYSNEYRNFENEFIMIKEILERC